MSDRARQREVGERLSHAATAREVAQAAIEGWALAFGGGALADPVVVNQWIDLVKTCLDFIAANGAPALRAAPENAIALSRLAEQVQNAALLAGWAPRDQGGGMDYGVISRGVV